MITESLVPRFRQQRSERIRTAALYLYEGPATLGSRPTSPSTYICPALPTVGFVSSSYAEGEFARSSSR
jgi:hypothetical protein